MSGGGWTPSHGPKNNGGTRSAAHGAVEGWYLYSLAHVHSDVLLQSPGKLASTCLVASSVGQSDRPRDGQRVQSREGSKEGVGPPSLVPGMRRMRFGAAASPPPEPLRLTAAVPSRGANCAGQGQERRQGAGRALGRREHLRRGFASSTPGMKAIRNPARLIDGRGPISTAVGALAPLPQPASQGPS